MFVAIRDIRFAKGRFALMGTVVLLITILLVMLSGLTSGLANQAISSLRSLPAGQVIFGGAGTSAPKADFGSSEVSAAQINSLKEHFPDAAPLGISTTKVRTTGTGDASTNVSIFGSGSGTGNATSVAPAPVASGEIVLSQSLAKALDTRAGDSVSVSGRTLKIAQIVPDQWYSHTAVGWVSLPDWSAQNPGRQPTAVVLPGAQSSELTSLNTELNTTSISTADAPGALEAFKSENGSLTMIQGFLYAISALVVGAFLAIWTIQRTRDIAVMKALGATNGYVTRDSLAQAFVVLLLGAGIGAAIGGAGGALAASVVPFAVSAVTIAVPAVGVLILGLLGSLVAVRIGSKVSPLTALGGN